MQAPVKSAMCLVMAAVLMLAVSGSTGGESVPAFSGTDSYIDLAMPDVLQVPSDSPLTVEGWMFLNSLDIRDMLYSKNSGRNTSGYSYLFGFISGKMAAYTGSAWRAPSAPTTIVAGRWYHLAFSFDGTNMSYYLDGESEGTSAFNFSNVEANTVKLGGYYYGADINGMKSDVRLWNHARSQAQIQANMNARLTGMEVGLLGYWPLNEGSGSQVLGGTVNASSGTMVNASWMFAESLDLALPNADFLLAMPFTLAALGTGSERFTNSNEVELVTSPVPDGYDLYQFSEDGGVSGIEPGAWVSTNSIPSSYTFTPPVTDTNMVLYVWFTNAAESVALRRAACEIFYTDVLSVPAVRPSLTRERLPGQNVVIYPSDLDVGSTGGEANGIVLDIISRASLCAETPGCDLTPGDPYVTIASEGDYPLLLWLKNEAGNELTSAATCMVSIVAYSGTNFWTNEGHTNLWSDAANWSAGVPVNDQDVVMDGGTGARLTQATAEMRSFLLGAGYALTVEGWESAVSAVNMTIAGLLTHAPQAVDAPDEFGDWVPEHRILLKGTNLTVTATGSLNADYKGYLPEAGPGRAVRGGGYGSGGGGGYGGHGGDGYQAQKHGPAYGDPADPWQPGSGGGSYNALDGVAGGAIRIEMGGSVTIDGTVTARGQNGGATHSTAASGGGIFIDCRTFQGAGTGLIRADAGRGNYYGGNGGGGRIALHYHPAAQLALANPRPPVRFSTHAWGTGSKGHSFTVKAEMGTLYLPDLTLLAETPTSDTVLGDQRFWYTRLVIGATFTNWSPASLTISNCVIDLPEGFTLDVGNDLILAGTAAPLTGNNTVRAGLGLYAAETNTLYGARLLVGSDFTIGSNAWFYPHTQGYSAAIVGVRVGRDFTVAAGGGVDANEEGYMPQSGNANGPGAGVSYDSGGSYGGSGGGSATGQIYGVAALPLDSGSPGGWRSHGGGFTETGRGGGAIHVLAGGDLLLDGLLTADGGRGWYYRGPAGSGGSIFLSGMRVRGSGELRASGGLGQDSRGPGGGGRIAVWYHRPLRLATDSVAARSLRGLVHVDPYADFDGELDVSVSTSVLTFQPGQGTTGFYEGLPLGTLITIK